MTTDRETIIDRVRKLLALAGNNSNVNEAAAAMARAQRLMLEHKLAQAELDADDPNAVDTEVGQMVLDEAGEFLLAWKPILMQVLVKASCCHAFRHSVVGPQGQKAVRFTIIGTESDATFVSYCYRYVCAEVDRLCDIEAKGKGFGFRNSFRRGAVDAISRRLGEARKQVIQEASAKERAAGASAGAAPPAAGDSKALAVFRKADDAVALYMKEKFSEVKFRTSRAAAVSSGGGYTSGRAAGEKIAIPGRDARPQLGAEPKRLRG
jgi:hypothetical protein